MSTFLQGKSVLVTGSSNGIGREVARMFAARGAKVAITGRNADNLRETRDLCIKAGAKKEDILGIISDLEDEATPRKLVEETVRKFGRIDVLINNAGMALADPEGCTTLNAPIELFDRTIAVNTRSILILTNLAAPYLEKTKGAVVNVSSICALPFGQLAQFYAISKAALDQLTVQLATNLIHKGIRVNAVNPGLIATDIHRKSGVDEETQKALFAAGSNRAVIPLGRVGETVDVANLIVFLSDRTQSEFIVGQRIVIDGGSTLKSPLLSLGQ